MIAILGPTSSGKTSTAIQLAKTHNLAIISCDSRQIYKKFDIGTGKVPINSNHTINKLPEYYEIDGARVYGYDIINPDQTYSAYDFGKYAKETIKKIQYDGFTPILVGGTGFYADAALGDIESLPEVKPDNELRNTVVDLSAEEIRNLLPQDIIENLNSSEFNNKQRLIRKYEVISKVGKIPQYKLNTDEHTLIVLDATNEYLYSRVDSWLTSIWQDLISETRQLIDESLRDSIPMKGIIYKSVVQFIDSKLTETESFNQARFDLHKYIRRQRTWFKKYKRATGVDISAPNPYNEIEHIVNNELNGI